MIVILRGHAFCGVWLQPKDLVTLTTDDPMEIRKAVDLDELVLFECTNATAGTPIPFSKAIQSARDQIAASNESSFVYALDVHRARGQQVQPLSTRGGTGGAQEDHQVRAPALPSLDQPPELPTAELEVEVKTEDLTPAERLERWKRSLLDLTKRNRLLNLRESITAIPILCPKLAELEDRIAAGKRIHIIPPPERHGESGATDPDIFRLRTGGEYAQRVAEEALERNEVIARQPADKLESGIVGLYRKAKADLEEGGANTLFLAIGMLRWRERKDSTRTFRAPLILLPVTLVRKSAATKPYLTSHDDDPVFNLTLLEMLRQDFAVTIPELEGQLPSDHSGIDVRRILEIVKHRVREVPRFEVVEETVLSTFSFAKYLMWKDLSDRTDQLKESPFVRHLIDTPRDSYRNGGEFLPPSETDAKIDPAKLLAPLNADSSQIVAIHASGAGGDFVLEGPPGTGKSETIGNIIAHNLGLGRRVLFVSEKMAALEVVYRRLQASGLSEFCLELHSAKANKKSVIAQLGAAWESRSSHSQAEWEGLSRELRQVRDRLNGVVKAIHAPGPGGVSPRQAIGRAVRYGDVHRLDLGWARDGTGTGHAPTPEALRELEELADELSLRHGELEPSDFEVFSRLEADTWSYEWQAQLIEVTRTLIQRSEALRLAAKSFRSTFGLPEATESPSEVAELCGLAELLADLPRTRPQYALEPDAPGHIENLEESLVRLESYRSARGQLTTAYDEDRIQKAPHGAWIEHREKAMRKTWPFRSLALRRLRESIRGHFGLSKLQAREPERDLEALRELSERQRELEQRTTSLPSQYGWVGLRTDVPGERARCESARRLRRAALRYSEQAVERRAVLNVIRERLCGDQEALHPEFPLARTVDPELTRLRWVM